MHSYKILTQWNYAHRNVDDCERDFPRSYMESLSTSL